MNKIVGVVVVVVVVLGVNVDESLVDLYGFRVHMAGKRHTGVSNKVIIPFKLCCYITSNKNKCATRYLLKSCCTFILVTSLSNKVYYSIHKPL